MEKLGSQWTDCHEIWHFRVFFKKFVEKIQYSLKSDKNTGCFVWLQVFDHISGNDSCSEKDKQCIFNVILRHVRGKRCCSTKAISISFSECVFMNTQHTTHVPPVVICALSGSAVFSTLFNKLNDFIKKMLYTKFVLWFSPQFCLKNFSF